MGEFFRAIPEVFAALWRFMDTWRGLGVTVGSLVLIVVFTGGAVRLRTSYGWVSAILGAMAATLVAWWVFGIIPSAWIYFADAERDLLGGRVIPNALDPVAANFYQVFRDSVAMAEITVAMGASIVAALWIQKRYSRSLADGEEKGPATGGYK
ncbi:MAG TPA: hypothetical protein VML96_03890 [Egibacteraceae bacterium]|nr:hypothetical protein [Egibacteraceae bacterium]